MSSSDTVALGTDAVWAGSPGGSPPWAIRAAFTNLLGISDPPSPSDRLLLWVIVLVSRECPDHDETLVRWANHLGKPFWVDVAEKVAGTGPPPTLAITGGRYLAALGRLPFDVISGDWVRFVPPNWLTTTVFNLRTLSSACEARGQKWTQKPQPSGPTPTPQPSALSPSPSTDTSRRGVTPTTSSRP